MSNEVLWDECLNEQLSNNINNNVDNNVIHFYREYDCYGELSNFYQLEKPIIYQNYQFKTSEHLYQALKYLYKNAPLQNLSYVQEIANASTPYKSKILANRSMTQHTIRYSWQVDLYRIIDEHKNVVPHPNWNNLKLSAMYFVLNKKFSQNNNCLQILLNTQNANIIEKSHDEYWGSGKSKNGSNYLGKLLMIIRNKYKTN